MRERQEGRYYGLGITIAVVDGDITVVSLFEGSPAYQKGLRRGDVIAKIEGEDTKGWTSDDAVKKLRGPKGTSVQHLAQARRLRPADRAGGHARRDPHPDRAGGASCSTRRPATSAYPSSARTPTRSWARRLRDLQRQGMKRLVFDLRGNPGGALDQAIRVANRFLPRGDMIVYTRGRVPNSDQDYRATEAERLPEHPDGDADQPQQRERVGDRLRRAAGSRPLAHRRRDDVRQGARAVGLSRQRGRGRRA